MANTLAAQIQMDEKLDVSYERVDKLDAPLLVVGLGGTGADAVRTIKETLARRFTLPRTADGKVIPVPRRTGYLVIDSDATGKDGLDDSEVVNISSGVSVAAMLKHPLHKDLTAEQKQWIHRDLHEVGQEGQIGAGTYRAASRLMLDCKFQEVYDRIHLALKKLVVMEAGGAGMVGAAQIFVVTGIGGGTGSGTFLDVGQIIRSMMTSEPDLNGIPYNLNSYIVMPDLTLSHVLDQGAPHMTDIIKRNSYAALKELDFWMDYKRHHTHYVMTYTGGKSITWREPFDHVTLMSGTNVEGNVFTGAYQLVQRTIAENLLHYMADEEINKTAGGTSQFSFLSYESNLHSQSQACLQNMTLPLNHAYRAVGAYSKRIPKKKILYYEGDLLFKTFIPPRNEHGVIVPNNKLLLDGKAQERFAQVAIKNFQNLYQDFAKGVPFPKMYQDFSARNKGLVEGMRKLNPPAHQSYAKWQENAIGPVARTFAEKYLQSIWGKFSALCRNIMSDPDYGPFSLLQYLEDERLSLRVAFFNYASQAQSKCSNLFGSISSAQQICTNSYQDFLKPPLLGGEKAVQNYLSALRDLLDTVRQYEFAKQYAHTMELMYKRIDAYIANALRPLCDLLVDLESDFSAPDNIVDSLGSDLFSVSTLHENIRTTFADANKDNAVSRSFLGKLCDSSFDAENNVDTGSCGLTFLFRQNGRLKALQLMKEEMDACFQIINSQSLESIMQLQCMDPDAATQTEKQKAYISNLANSVVDSATPLFSLASVGNKAEIVANTAKCLYFSVPQDAHTFLQQLSADSNGTPVTVKGSSLTPKASSLTDHIYCNMTWDVLPLYSYSLMDDIKKAYDNTLKNPSGSAAPALHLVWNGDADGDYKQNWCKLPSPAPFYLFDHDTKSIREKKDYENARSLAQRAFDTGMLTINSTEENPAQYPQYTFRIFRDGAGALHNEAITERLNEVLMRKDPVTGAPISPIAKAEALYALMNEADSSAYTARKSPTIMKNKLGIDESKHPIDPFVIDNNPVKLREAKKNYYVLMLEYTAHILLQNPNLLYEVEYQIESFEKISREIKLLIGQTKVWEPRIAYAETFAKLFAYGLVSFDMMGNPTYINESGEVAPLIQPAIFKEDLKECRRVVKGVGVAADLDVEHDIRKSLEFRLSVLERNWEDAALRSALTAQQVADQIARLEEIASEASGERKAYISQKQSDMNADHALLGKYTTLLQAVETYANSRLELLRRIKFGPVTESAPKTEAAPKAEAAPKTEAAPAAAADTWVCPECGRKDLSGKFCPECGAKRPVKVEADAWTCPDCGKTGLTGKFCPECGARRPQAAPVKLTWICTECGTRDITGKFCPECGSPRQNA